jgi:putative methyltransferase
MPKQNVYLFQPQYVNIFNGQKQYWLPYTVGSVWAYTQQFPHIRDNFNLGDIFFKREPIDLVLSKLDDPKVCGFSVYVWNEIYCLELAKQIKMRWPQCQIVVGGPQVSSSWTKHSFVDAIVLNEGERCFVTILETLLENKPLELFYKLPRIEDLIEVPSPYSLKIFDKIVFENPTVFWSTTLETNRGCPYSCTFCDWGGLISSKIKKFPLERVQEDLEWIAKNRVKTIFISDANFGIFKERDLSIAHMVRDCADDPESHLEYISVTYAKNSTEDVFQIAKAFGPKHKGITFSVQSMNPDTLKVIKRKNMDVNNIQSLLELGKKYNVHHYTELILGLPLESKESWKDGLAKILELGQHHRLEVHPNNVLENTEMHASQINHYGIKLINTQDILPLSGQDESGVPEFFPTVYATNTMSRDDMIESWLYSWMIIHFHINGYSQLLAKYCYHALGVSYRQFYDNLFDRLKDSQPLIQNEFQKMKKIITNFYTIGTTADSDISAGNMLFNSSKFFYDNIKETLDFVIRSSMPLGNIDPGIVDLQQRYINNDTYTTPMTVKTSHNINSWEQTDSIYEITEPEEKIQIDKLALFTLQRRNKKLLNNIKLL